ncbi:hypothetical protein [Streptomyces sp. TR06-5]|uniref:hypothetical protein n=1 Tax=unclassified Streptomyces TaxID=2593676 RepID=UPI0039A2EBB6
MSDAATETPEAADAAPDSPAAGHGRHRGPAAEGERKTKNPGPGRHRRAPHQNGES